jgi:hypothetical protein
MSLLCNFFDEMVIKNNILVLKLVSEMKGGTQYSLKVSLINCLNFVCSSYFDAANLLVDRQSFKNSFVTKE